MPSGQTKYTTSLRCLLGIGRCMIAAGLIALALTVLSWRWLSDNKQRLAPAGLVLLALTVIFWTWLAVFRRRAAVAATLLVAIVAITAGTTLGVDEPYLKAFPGDGSAGVYDDYGRLLLEISPGNDRNVQNRIRGEPR